MDQAQPSDVEIQNREVVYQGFFRMARYQLRHRRFAGDWTGVMPREVFERGHAVALLPYDPWRDRLVLIEQFRIGAYLAGFAPWLVEVPAGIIAAGETAPDVAHRETQEETGCPVDALEPIQSYLVSPGGTSESVALYCGRIDSSQAGGLHGLASENEDIRVFTLPAGEAKRRLHEGRLTNAATLIALQWFTLNHEALYKAWTKPDAAGNASGGIN